MQVREPPRTGAGSRTVGQYSGCSTAPTCARPARPRSASGRGARRGRGAPPAPACAGPRRPRCEQRGRGARAATPSMSSASKPGSPFREPRWRSGSSAPSAAGRRVAWRGGPWCRGRSRRAPPRSPRGGRAIAHRAAAPPRSPWIADEHGPAAPAGAARPGPPARRGTPGRPASCGAPRCPRGRACRASDPVAPAAQAGPDVRVAVQVSPRPCTRTTIGRGGRPSAILHARSFRPSLQQRSSRRNPAGGRPTRLEPVRSHQHVGENAPAGGRPTIKKDIPP